MAANPPVFTATSTSARQLNGLLRCISVTKSATVRLGADGLRISTEEGSAMEAFVFLAKDLFSTYNYNASPPPSSQDDAPPPPVFEVNLAALLETLSIFTLSDPNTTAKKESGGYDAFAAHRLNRHAGIGAFSGPLLSNTGTCTFTYRGEGSALEIHMAEAGCSTTCELTTYEPQSIDEIPFNRDALALKTIMRSSYLLDAVNELSSMNPQHITILAKPSSRGGVDGGELSLTAAGALGSATVDFTTNTASETPILETFSCSSKTSASFKFALIKSAQRAMAAATKVSMRLDEEGVLSLQFLVEVEAGSGQGEGVAFVDFRVVPLVEGEAEGEDDGSNDSSED